MQRTTSRIAAVLGVWLGLVALHAPFLKLPYYWDEAGYYVPAALDFFRHGLLIPSSTEPIGHTPLVSVYLAVVWRIFGFSPLVTRAAMILFAAGTVTATAVLARRLFADRAAGREAAFAAAGLLAVTPLFFAQSELVFLDLAVAFFSLVALMALLDERWILSATMGSLAVLTKETAIVLLPAAWVYLWIENRRAGRRFPVSAWLATAAPCLPLALWALYYHRHTGFWTGNAGYLQYNLYSTLNPVRFVLSLLRRLYELFLSGFNWLLVAPAVAGWWSSRNHPQITQIQQREQNGKRIANKAESWRRLILLTALLSTAYLLMLSAVGGAVLLRYMLPIYPPLMIVAVGWIWRLPRGLARATCIAAAACLVFAWFNNPPYPFPYEDNLAFADFIHLHQQAAEYLEHRDAAESAGGSASELRILSAWPATNELETPDLGYVTRPLRVVPVGGFSAGDLQRVAPESFDVLYLYSRKWEPPGDWVERLPWMAELQLRYFDYSPQMTAQALASRFHLKLSARWERGGQWVAIYER
ncbi:MAG TPA: glycosyltransferase family 39 protein [Terriglobia bacterium]|nr:glycosyltransferase family 39 protein [Terriglobia bacterium]